MPAPTSEAKEKFDPHAELIRYRFFLPAPIAFKLESFLADPLRPGKRRYGALNHLMQQLITDFFTRLEQNPNPTARFPEDKK